jgi:hypothetical protein
MKGLEPSTFCMAIDHICTPMDVPPPECATSRDFQNELLVRVRRNALVRRFWVDVGLT